MSTELIKEARNISQLEREAARNAWSVTGKNLANDRADLLDALIADLERAEKGTQLEFGVSTHWGVHSSTSESAAHTITVNMNSAGHAEAHSVVRNVGVWEKK